MGEALYSSLDYRFAFEWDEHELGVLGCRLLDEFAERVAPRTPGFAPLTRYVASTESRAKGPWYTLRVDAEIVTGAPRPEPIAEQLMWRSSATVIEECEAFLPVHAGAVSTPDGDGVLVLGDSGAGKTTLVGALVQEGYGFLSDEAGVIDPADGTLHPWPRPLGFMLGTQQLARFAGVVEQGFPGRDGSRIILAGQLRLDPIGPRCPVREIVDYRFRAGAETAIRTLSSGEAVVAMGRSAPGLRRHGQSGLRLIAGLAEGARKHSLISGELDQAVRALRELVER